MNRATRRRLERGLGKHRSERKRGRRGAIRVAQLNEQATAMPDSGPERHKELVRLPAGFVIARSQIILPKGS